MRVLTAIGRFLVVSARWLVRHPLVALCSVIFTVAFAMGYSCSGPSSKKVEGTEPSGPTPKVIMPAPTPASTPPAPSPAPAPPASGATPASSSTSAPAMGTTPAPADGTKAASTHTWDLAAQGGGGDVLFSVARCWHTAPTLASCSVSVRNAGSQTTSFFFYGNGYASDSENYTLPIARISFPQGMNEQELPPGRAAAFTVDVRTREGGAKMEFLEIKYGLRGVLSVLAQRFGK